jgi:hypothetical protein
MTFSPLVFQKIKVSIKFCPKNIGTIRNRNNTEKVVIKNTFISFQSFSIMNFKKKKPIKGMVYILDAADNDRNI